MGGYIMSSTINADTTNGVVVTSDTSGEIELQSAGVTKAKVTANGLQDANGNSLRGGSFLNLIINGDMQIAQRATSVSSITSAGYKTCDRWQTNIGTGGTWTQSQDTGVTNEGFANSLKYDCTTANASLSSGSNLNLCHRFEGQNLQHLKKGTANAESVTISFWVKSNKTGDYVFELWDRDNDRHIADTYTVSSANTWEKKTITFAGDTSGAFDNDANKSLEANWWLVAGTDYTTGTAPTSWASRTNANRAVGQTVNLADSTSNYINITGVQLEVGEGASDFEFLPYDVQLARCQRYFERMAGAVNVPYSSGSATYANQPRTVLFYKTQKRAVPTLSSSAASEFRFQFSSSVNTPSAISLASIGVDTAFLNASGITISADTPCILISNSSSSFLDFSSEL